jgi:hypothetical protein
MKADGVRHGITPQNGMAGDGDVAAELTRPLALIPHHMRRMGGEEHPPGDIAASCLAREAASRTDHGMETLGTIMRTGAFADNPTGAPHG